MQNNHDPPRIFLGSLFLFLFFFRSLIHFVCLEGIVLIFVILGEFLIHTALWAYTHARQMEDTSWFQDFHVWGLHWYW